MKMDVKRGVPKAGIKGFGEEKTKLANCHKKEKVSEVN